MKALRLSIMEKTSINRYKHRSLIATLIIVISCMLSGCHWCPAVEEEYCNKHYYTTPPHHHNNGYCELDNPIKGYCNFKYNKYMCITHRYHICHLCNEYVYVYAAICPLATYEHTNYKLCPTLAMFHKCPRLR